jgi:Tfp pilus assembly protein PilN
MLDQVSRALPQMLWLTQLKQTGTDLVLDGKCTTLTGLSEFVSNLEASGYFKRSIEIVDTKSEMAGTPPSEIIKFTIKAVFQQPGEPAKPAAAAKAGG